MKAAKSERLDACDIARLARHIAERVLDALDEDDWRELREAPRDVRRMVRNLAIARVLEVVNLPEPNRASKDDRAAAVEGDCVEVCDRFRVKMLGLCSDLHEMHPELAALVCDKRDMSNVGSLPDSSGQLEPEESGSTCLDCHRGILKREPMWSVNVHRETYEGGGLSVLQADCYLVLCEACAGKWDFDRVVVPLRSVTQVRVAGSAFSISRFFEGVVESKNGASPVQ